MTAEVAEASILKALEIDELEKLALSEDLLRKVFTSDRKQWLEAAKVGEGKSPLTEALAGKFAPERTTYIHQVTLPSGTRIRLKFFNVVKEMLNSKGTKIHGKESWLSYVEVTSLPVGVRAFSFTFEVNREIWGTSKAAADKKHNTNCEKLEAYAKSFGIDLTNEEAWCSIYTKGY